MSLWCQHGTGDSTEPPLRDFEAWAFSLTWGSGLSRRAEASASLSLIRLAEGNIMTRTSSAPPVPLRPLSTGPIRPSQLSSTGSVEAGKSVIGNDLRITGQGLKIISRGILQVDGDLESDVVGAEVIVGEQGRVTGTIAAERVIVRGRTSGAIRAMSVALQPSARVEGDIHHMSLTIEQGAEFDGRCRRPSDASELRLDLDGV
jgi:cytoskeletal protein CcmA (bactofilin family)